MRTKIIILSIVSAHFAVTFAFAEQELPSKEHISRSTGMKFARIPAGEFLMGSPASEEEREDTERRHRVIISQPFLMGIHEVTQERRAYRVENRTPTYVCLCHRASTKNGHDAKSD